MKRKVHSDGNYDLRSRVARRIIDELHHGRAAVLAEVTDRPLRAPRRDPAHTAHAA